ncbi:MAG: hypothetical protein EA383_06720 [Spirochaetaceae bacterium]|nr:MAG: hypothetical protein EA383_06720 [Spirochaetaceae bacterium]
MGLIPYDQTNPIIYDNDDHRDVYTDEYLLSLASAGEIDLRGIVTTYTHDKVEYDEFVTGRKKIISLARQSGFRNLPETLAGCSEPLRVQESGRIEDTVFRRTPGSDLIVTEARRASPDKPLVIITGGPFTTVATAYLSDPEIADCIIVSSLCGSENGMYGWNAGIDLWASHVVLDRIRMVIFPENRNLEYGPVVRKPDLAALPDTPLRSWMIRKQHPVNELPADRDADGQPAISIASRDYCIDGFRVEHSGFDGEVPLFSRSETGKSLFIDAVDQDAATREFFRALTRTQAYHELAT